MLSLCRGLNSESGGASRARSSSFPGAGPEMHHESAHADDEGGRDRAKSFSGNPNDASSASLAVAAVAFFSASISSPDCSAAPLSKPRCNSFGRAFGGLHPIDEESPRTQNENPNSPRDATPRRRSSLTSAAPRLSLSPRPPTRFTASTRRSPSPRRPPTSRLAAPSDQDFLFLADPWPIFDQIVEAIVADNVKALSHNFSAAQINAHGAVTRTSSVQCWWHPPMVPPPAAYHPLEVATILQRPRSIAALIAAGANTLLTSRWLESPSGDAAAERVLCTPLALATAFGYDAIMRQLLASSPYTIGAALAGEGRCWFSRHTHLEIEEPLSPTDPGASPSYSVHSEKVRTRSIGRIVEWQREALPSTAFRSGRSVRPIVPRSPTRVVRQLREARRLRDITM